MEHTTLHLLYSRFWHKFLYDIGVVPTKEPYLKRTSHGMVLGENGDKMSKSRGNVVNPDDYIRDYGADSFRMYIMFMGAFDQPIPWNAQGTKGCRRFLERVWRLQDMVSPEEGVRDCLKASLNACIKKVGEDIERMKFNTAIAALMSFVNDAYAAESITREELRTLLVLLSPFAPHIAEEINAALELGCPLYAATWPNYDPAALVEETLELGVQVNGKVRARVLVPSGMANEEIQALVLANDELQPFLEGKSVKKVIVARNVVNVVVG